MTIPTGRWDSDGPKCGAPASEPESRLVQGGRSLKARGEQLLGWAAFRAASSTKMRRFAFDALRLGRASVSRLTPLPELQFLAYVFDNVERSRAQILQDLWVCWELGEARNGYFVEFGATDGVTNSNTALLEGEFGWHGILAEPNPAWHTRLRHNRQVDIDQRCLAARTGEQVEFLVVDDPELSTIASYAGGDHFAEVRRRSESISVETVALNDLLDAHDAPKTIDYMSIDTEGSECEILSTFDFHRWRVRLFSIEHNNTDRGPELDELLARHGYRRVFPEFSQWDGWYRLDPSLVAT